MAQIELRLSGREQENGTREILIRFYQGSKFNLRAKSGIYINPEYFEYKINWGKTLEAGVAMPKKTIKATTLSNAAKRGYVLHDCGEIVINGQKVISPAEKDEIKKKQEKISDLKDFINESYDVANKDEVKGDWLKDVLDKHLHPEKYMTEEEKNAKKTVYELFDDYIKEKGYSYDQEKAIRVLERDIARYEGYKREVERQDKFTFNVHSVTRDDIEDFFCYLRNEKHLSEEYPETFKRLLALHPAGIGRGWSKISERGDNSLMKMKKRLKAFFSWLYETGKTDNKPFVGIKIGSGNYGTPYYITIDERNTLADAPMPTKHLETQRDIFIFQCLTGCRVSDLQRLTPSNVVDGVLRYIPKKTRREGQKVAEAIVPLHPKAVALIEKYRGVDTKGRLFPFISDQKYNDAIKEAFTVAGITREVVVRNSVSGLEEVRPINEIASSHLARRTFVGNLYRQVADPNLIGKMSGHVEGSKAFARYRDIDEEMLSNTINLLG